jgi:hypothetical protein
MLEGVQPECGDGGGFGVAKNANTPHSSRSVSPSRSSCSSMPVPRWSAGSEGVCISSIAPLYRA